MNKMIVKNGVHILNVYKNGLYLVIGIVIKYRLNPLN